VIEQFSLSNHRLKKVKVKEDNVKDNKFAVEWLWKAK
jgi:hypothetical protein